VKYLLILIALVSGVVVASCTCGGNELPCSSSTDCPGSGPCISGHCENRDGDAGTHGGVGGWDGGGQPCVGLGCQQVHCSGSTATTLTGTVFTPAGDLPLYNAIVYVPNGAVKSFPDGGVTCDRCGAAASGNPLVASLTGPDGTFRLENVPAGQNIPLVIQMGKWRRQVTLPTVTACQVGAVDVAITRLPRNKSEGDIPKMAIATGEFDPFECLLRKVGLDDAEITAPSGTGRVHFFRAHGGVDLSSPAPRSNQLWESLDTLKRYDVIMLPCEGTISTTEVPKTLAGKQNFIDYTTAGGRMFITHFSYSWITSAPQPFPSVANWNLTAADPVSPYSEPFDVAVDTSFPKGDAFADWLLNVQASTERGILTLHETRHNVNSVNSPAAQRWLYGYNTLASAPIVTHFTFNTPVSHLSPDAGAPDQCGRVVFSSFHVSANALGDGGTTFPTICRNEPPSAQEKALIFMLFDLSSCVQRDELPVIL
jgi:hypothetical protein